jgi:hypothetical protein
MRLYVPAVRADLDDVRLSAGRATWSLEPRGAHALTPALRTALPDEDDEGLEYAAWLAAVDDSLGLVLAGATSPLRVVVTVEVPDGAVALDQEDGELAESAVRLIEAVDAQVVCAHVDEPEAGPDVLAVGQVAEAQLEEALQRVVDRDLLWYDWSELAQVPR